MARPARRPMSTAIDRSSSPYRRSVSVRPSDSAPSTRLRARSGTTMPEVTPTSRSSASRSGGPASSASRASSISANSCGWPAASTAATTVAAHARGRRHRPQRGHPAGSLCATATRRTPPCGSARSTAHQSANAGTSSAAIRCSASPTSRVVDSAALTPASTASRLCARSVARYASSRSASACTLAVTSACTPTKLVSRRPRRTPGTPTPRSRTRCRPCGS